MRLAERIIHLCLAGLAVTSFPLTAVGQYQSLGCSDPIATGNPDPTVYYEDLGNPPVQKTVPGERPSFLDTPITETLPGGLDDGPLLSDNFGAADASFASNPAIIGDFFGGGLQFIGATPDPFTAPLVGGDRIFKIVENMSAFPTDRVFFNYHAFTNAVTSANNQELDLYRYVLGIEKTVLDGNVSFEIRVPFATGLNANQDISPVANPDSNQGTEFGNIAFAIKALLIRRRNMSISAGMGLSTPTGQDSKLLQGTSLFATFKNEAFFFQPFMAMLYEPNQRTWVQFVSQASIAANGNSFILNGGESGVVQDQSLLFLTTSVGSWIYRTNDSAQLIRGVAPILELHYSTTMQDTDEFTSNQGKRVRNLSNRMDVLNMTGGIRTQLGSQSFLTISASVPLRDDEEALYDSEISMQFTRTY